MQQFSVGDATCEHTKVPRRRGFAVSLYLCGSDGFLMLRLSSHSLSLSLTDLILFSSSICSRRVTASSLTVQAVPLIAHPTTHMHTVLAEHYHTCGELELSPGMDVDGAKY